MVKKITLKSKFENVSKVKAKPKVIEKVMQSHGI